jgi:hypothetical protein
VISGMPDPLPSVEDEVPFTLHIRLDDSGFSSHPGKGAFPGTLPDAILGANRTCVSSGDPSDAWHSLRLVGIVP